MNMSKDFLVTMRVGAAILNLISAGLWFCLFFPGFIWYGFTAFQFPSDFPILFFQLVTGVFGIVGVTLFLQSFNKKSGEKRSFLWINLIYILLSIIGFNVVMYSNVLSLMRFSS